MGGAEGSPCSHHGYSGLGIAKEEPGLWSLQDLDCNLHQTGKQRREAFEQEILHFNWDTTLVWDRIECEQKEAEEEINCEKSPLIWGVDQRPRNKQ